MNSRENSAATLFQPEAKTLYGKRTFQFCDSKFWNILPIVVPNFSAQVTLIALKTHLFKEQFHSSRWNVVVFIGWIVVVFHEMNCLRICLSHHISKWNHVPSKRENKFGPCYRRLSEDHNLPIYKTENFRYEKDIVSDGLLPRPDSLRQLAQIFRTAFDNIHEPAWSGLLYVIRMLSATNFCVDVFYRKVFSIHQ